MACIKVLDQNMINMIAAGEVIERPASVVKELIENSIDSGADKIVVNIEEGGRKLISVTDNGCGMDTEDLRLAFEPHATSKINSSADLSTISTLGFRGEALASISSIAQLTATSRTKNSLQANSVSIDCGQNKNLCPASADYGTKIQVRDIFYKLPARQKFLKSANTEMNHITECFKRIALANPNINLTLIHNKKEIYNLHSGDGLKNRIRSLFGNSVAEGLIETSSHEKNVNIKAFLGRPEISKTNKNTQYFFLNGRFIKDKFIFHALNEAYRSQLEPNRHPAAFVFIELPPDDFDVNVHPTKIEVRFYNSNLIHSLLLSTIRQKLLSTNMDVSFKTSPENFERKQHIKDAMEDFFKKNRPAAHQQNMPFSSYTKNSANKPQFDSRNFTAPSMPESSQSVAPKNFIQIHNSYIVSQNDNGFVIIDQHALHERIIYEKLKKRVSKNSLESQKQLVPETVELTQPQAENLNKNLDIFEKLGIQIEPFGPNTYAIHSFPLLLTKADPADFVIDLIDILDSKLSGTNSDQLLDEILNMAACKAAIKAGQKLTDDEIQHLLDQKEKTDYSSRCPHGRPTTITFSIPELEKQFKRT
ncbi:MAG: DNA mismatch repair endonuclease MutL [Planctomycetes bacterium]|nr:DNA mismatch repair endonuclease MutL [Planctomycetota bacterium]